MIGMNIGETWSFQNVQWHKDVIKVANNVLQFMKFIIILIIKLFILTYENVKIYLFIVIVIYTVASDGRSGSEINSGLSLKAATQKKKNLF